MSSFRSTFRVAFSSRHSEPHLQFDVQIHRLSFVDVQSRPPYSLVFRATITSQVSIQNHVFSLAFRATTFLELNVQIHHRFLVMTFKVVFLNLTFKDVSSRLWHSKPSSSSIWRSESHLQLGVQSHQPFSFMVFRAFILFSLSFRVTIPSQLWRSKLSSSSVWRSKPHFQFSIQSHHLFTVWRSEPSSSLVWRSEPPSLLNLGVQSHHIFSV